MRQGDWAWVALGVGVITWEAVCPPGDLFSERMDVYRRAQPILAYAGIFYIAAHLARLIPGSCDPLTQLAVRFGK